jgi:hypothetical protein
MQWNKLYCEYGQVTQDSDVLFVVFSYKASSLQHRCCNYHLTPTCSVRRVYCIKINLNEAGYGLDACDSG